jgi:hypothetical protein
MIIKNGLVLNDGFEFENSDIEFSEKIEKIQSDISGDDVIDAEGCYVVPGFVETPWQKEKPEEIKQNIYRKTAIHRFATIDEIVDAFRFCIDNPFVNGSLIEINGGYNYK